MTKKMTWSEAIQALNQGREIKLAMAEDNDKRIEARASERKPLTFDEVEACFPSGGGTNEYGEVVVSAQWLHEFADNIQKAAYNIKD